MVSTLYPLIKSCLFTLDAEKAHDWTLNLLSRSPRVVGKWVSGPRVQKPALGRELFGLPIPNPVGLAAGLDKNGVALSFWPSLGFGFVEVGTVTALPQPGNPKPRLFRLPNEQALINRMGFNNHGSEALAAEMRKVRDAGNWPAVPIGANVGKSKITPLTEAAEDYATSIRRLQSLADYFTINVSSPNTPGLRELQRPDALKSILEACLTAAKGTPVAIKISPDLENDPLLELVELVCEAGISGIIATNTTVRREGLKTDPNETGGLSGRPIWTQSRSVIETVVQAARGRIPVVGCGGVDSPERADDLLALGCQAVQLYTALIYHGPTLPNKINAGLSLRLT